MNLSFHVKNEEISPSDPNQKHFFGLARGSNVCLVTKKLRKIKKFHHFFDVSGQLQSFNGQPDISEIILLFFLVLGMILIPSE